MLLKSLQLSCTSIAAHHFEEKELRLENNSECMIVCILPGAYIGWLISS